MKKLSKQEIDRLWNEIRTNYYNASELKNYDKNELYFAASSSLDIFFLQLIHDSQTDRNMIDEIYSPLRSAFREELVLFGKNAQKNQTINFNGFDESALAIQKKTMYELIQYNFIRNRLEAGYLGDIEINYDETTKSIATSQETDSALIARYEDAEKYCYDKKSLVKKGANHIIAYIVGCVQTLISILMSENYEYLKLLEEMKFPHRNSALISENDFKSNQNQIREIINFAECDYNAKCDVTGNYDLGCFTLEDHKKVYCCLMALCLNRMQYCFLNLTWKNIPPNPNVIWHKEKLIEYIEFFTSLTAEKIQFILQNFLIYSADFQLHDDKEYLSLYQPIFDMNDYYVINSSLTIINCAQRKLIWQINKLADKYPTYQNIISVMANDKEKIMISEILSFLSKNHYNIKNNFRFAATDKQNADVEIDISILDSEQKVLFLIECKDHLPIDNEFERKRQDQVLISEAECRAEKNKIILENLELYVSRAHASSVLPNKVMSILVANHYGGSNTENVPIPIISKATFFKLLKLHSYDLASVYQDIENKNYKPADLRQEAVSAEFLDYTLKSWCVNNKIATIR